MAKPRYVTLYGYFGATSNVRQVTVPVSADVISRVLGSVDRAKEPRR